MLYKNYLLLLLSSLVCGHHGPSSIGWTLEPFQRWPSAHCIDKINLRTALYINYLLLLLSSSVCGHHGPLSIRRTLEPFQRWPSAYCVDIYHLELIWTELNWWLICIHLNPPGGNTVAVQPARGSASCPGWSQGSAQSRWLHCSAAGWHCRRLHHQAGRLGVYRHCALHSVGMGVFNSLVDINFLIYIYTHFFIFFQLFFGQISPYKQT